MIFISKKINYEEELAPIYIESMEASHVYMNDFKNKTKHAVEYKVKKQWVEFTGITTRKSVLADSLFLRYMNSSIIRKKRDGVYDCPDFIVLRFKYDVNLRSDGVEEKVNIHELRTMYYKDGVNYTSVKRDECGEVVEPKKTHYKMLMRSPGKAKSGSCVFIRDELYVYIVHFEHSTRYF